MVLSKLERLEALLGDDQLSSSFDRLALNNEEQGNDNAKLRGGGARNDGVEPTDIKFAEGSFDFEHEDKYEESDVPETSAFLGRHVWTHDPTTASKVNLIQHDAGVASGQFTLDPRRGQLSTSGELFAPIVAISKFPYKFVSEAASQPIASAFFDKGKFWLREWELYYIHPPHTVAKKPILLIPLQQVEALFLAISKTFVNFRPEVSQGLFDIGLIVKFPDHPHIRPRFLGKSTSKAQFNFLELNVPPPSTMGNPDEYVPPPDDRTFEAFESKVQAILNLNKNRHRQAKARKRDDRIQRQQEMVRSLKRAQRYLGLRPKSQRESILTQKFETWEDERDAFAKASERVKLPPVDVSYPAAYPFDSSVVFVCVDVEVWEKDHSIITEIGVSTLDTLDLIGVPPGKNGINWEPKIHQRHFRVAEYAHLRNSEYVASCPDKFEFGQSEFISVNDAPAILASIFTPVSTLPSDQRAAHYTPPKYAFLSTTGERITPPIRNVVLVGHDVQMDICYLRNLAKDFDPLFPNKTPDGAQTSPVIDVIDTAYMYRVLTHDMNNKQLAMILVEFEIAGWNLHNAGNDAAYTMHAMLAIALRAAEGRKSREEKPQIGSGEEKVGEEKSQEEKNEEALQERIKLAVEEAEQRVRDAEEGWESDEGDGGAPLPPSEMSMSMKQSRSKGKRKSSDGGVTLTKMDDTAI